MIRKPAFHVLVVGWDHSIVEGLWDRISAQGRQRISHIVPPRYTASEWPDQPPRSNIHFFCDVPKPNMPQPDHALLASLEQEGIPTVHNMIMGDRIVSKLSYQDALSYATFLARRLLDLFGKVEPSVIIGGFDAVHSGLALAVARRMNIPWFSLNFSVLPSGLACFCDGLSPAARVVMRKRPLDELRASADEALQDFENKRIQAPAYIAPPPLPLAGKLAKLPARLAALRRTLSRSRSLDLAQFTYQRTSYSVPAALGNLRRAAEARKAISRVSTLTEPPSAPYVFFGLHMQPESSIDVWAPFFSNQIWVIELLSRSIPPTHKLLVKIHKSDISNYSREQLRKMQSFPGVELVAPFADARNFIRNAGLVVAIQGTIGLEAALLGKPVIMLADSPVKIFPSASGCGEIADMPILVRKKLAETAPSRVQIVNAYASYLAPFLPASLNNWAVEKTAEEIDGYVSLFNMLEQYVLEKTRSNAGEGRSAAPQIGALPS